jgi:hypothetical protein
MKETAEFFYYGSSLTDWIQSIAAIIAVPGAISGFFVLFRKNKEQDQQIKKLTEIAVKIEEQNMIILEGNSILERQVGVLRGLLTSQIEAVEGAKKLEKLEKEKFLLSHRPKLIFVGGKSSTNEVSFYIENRGEIALIETVQDISGDKLLQLSTRFPPSFEVKKGATFDISASLQKNESSYSGQINFRIEVKYTDQVGNLYSQEFYGTVGSKYLTTHPKLIQEAD